MPRQATGLSSGVAGPMMEPPMCVETVSQETAKDLALTAAACALIYGAFEGDEAFHAFSELRGSIGSMELYDRFATLAAVVCPVWDALDLSVRDTVTWDFQFLDHAVAMMVNSKAGWRDDWTGFADDLRIWAIAEAARSEQLAKRRKEAA